MVRGGRGQTPVYTIKRPNVAEKPKKLLSEVKQKIENSDIYVPSISFVSLVQIQMNVISFSFVTFTLYSTTRFSFTQNFVMGQIN